MPLTKFATPTGKDFLPRMGENKSSSTHTNKNGDQSFLSAFADGATYLTLNGRNAIFLALKALSIPKGSVVLIPSYHCRALVEPILAYGCKVEYYSISKNLELDLVKLESQIQINKVSVLLCIHFFGFEAPIQALAKICAENRIKLIEDCTHALFGKIGASWMGTFGDASVFSFRKTLAVQDGGALFIPKEKGQADLVSLNSPLIYHFRMAKWTWDFWKGSAGKDWHPQREEDAESSGLTPKKESQKKSTASSKGPLSHEDADFHFEYLNWTMSVLSKWILSQADAEKIRKIRQDHFLWFSEKMKNIEEITLFHSDISPGLSPLGFPFLSKTPGRADYGLRKAAIPAFSFGEDLHHSLQLTHFPDTQLLSEKVCLLPVHQTLSTENLNRILKAVEAYFLPSRIARR